MHIYFVYTHTLSFISCLIFFVLEKKRYISKQLINDKLDMYETYIDLFDVSLFNIYKSLLSLINIKPNGLITCKII